MKFAPARISEFTMELDIAAPAESVWTSLTTDIGNWWPQEFYAGGKSGERRFSLEPVPGGRMCEEWDAGGGILWATVIGAEPAKRLQVCGHSFPNWGGPSQWFGTWELKPAASGTLLRFSEHAIGRVSDSYVDEKDKGWRFLWNTLKAQAENQPLPVWND